MYIKYTVNKDHREMYSVIRNNLYMKGIWKIIDLWICITKSLWCTPEINIVNQLYSNIKIKKNTCSVVGANPGHVFWGIREGTAWGPVSCAISGYLHPGLWLSLDTYILVFAFASRTFHSLFSPFHFLQLPSLLELLSLPMRQPLVVLGHKLCFSSMNSYFPECLGKSVMVLY